MSKLKPLIYFLSYTFDNLNLLRTTKLKMNRKHNNYFEH